MDSINSSVSNLLSTNMCSPLISFIVICIVYALSLIHSRNILKKFNNVKMENLYQLFSLYEVKFLVVMGVILYGLCQYNQVTLAWTLLFLPPIYLMLKSLCNFFFISIAHQNAPKDAPKKDLNQQDLIQSLLKQTQSTNSVDKTINMNSNINTNNNSIDLHHPMNSNDNLSPPLNSIYSSLM
jgi:hypothetical protein